MHVRDAVAKQKTHRIFKKLPNFWIKENLDLITEESELVNSNKIYKVILILYKS